VTHTFIAIVVFELCCVCIRRALKVSVGELCVLGQGVVVLIDLAITGLGRAWSSECKACAVGGHATPPSPSRLLCRC
jgi:hypothetical protein